MTAVAAPPDGVAEGTPEGWVPADHRWLGFDTRTKGPALIVLGFALLFIVVIPLLTGLKSWDNQTRAGDVVRIGPELVVTPPVGWNLQDGLRTTEGAAKDATSPTVTLAGSGNVVTFQRIEGIGTSTARDLVERAAKDKDLALRVDRFSVDGNAGTIRTSSGLTGVRRSFIAPDGTGQLIAFRVPGVGGAAPTGLVIQVDDENGLGDDPAAVNDMIHTLSLSGASS